MFLCALPGAMRGPGRRAFRTTRRESATQARRASACMNDHVSSRVGEVAVRPQSPYCIEIGKLNFSYDQSRVFLDFDFQSDARVSVFRGPSGCGKTTLLKLLYG